MSTVRGLVVSVAFLLPREAAEEAARSIPWERDHRSAYTAAEERAAPLLVHFRSDHCERTTPGLAGPPGGTTRGGSVGENPRAGGTSGRTTRDDASDCDRMEELVWSHPEVVATAARYVAVLTGDTADRTLTRRYEAATMPTTLIADPWGNEIVRLVRFVDAAHLIRILKAVPGDFSPLAPVGRGLRARPRDAELLMKAAAFYESARLLEIAERYYERATGTAGFRTDPALRRRLAVARGTGLLRLGKSAAAANIFREAFEEAADGEQGDTVLFGWMMAELQQERVKEAERPYRELLARFPGSKYSVKARENFAAARKN